MTSECTSLHDIAIKYEAYSNMQMANLYFEGGMTLHESMIFENSTRFSSITVYALERHRSVMLELIDALKDKS